MIEGHGGLGVKGVAARFAREMAIDILRD